jgi:hypothetical protein
MSNAASNIPLAIPADMHREVKRAAKETRLSQADVMRQSIRFGLPRLLDAFRGPGTPKAQGKPTH